MSHGDTFASYFMALLGSDIQLDPPKGCQFCDSCQPRVELLFQFISGFRFVECCLFFAMGPLPVYVCLWSMTSEGTRKLLDSARDSQAGASASNFMHLERTQNSSLQDITVSSRQPPPAPLTAFLCVFALFVSVILKPFSPNAAMPVSSSHPDARTICRTLAILTPKA